MKIYEIPDSNLKITLDERVEENDLKKRIEQLENTLNILFEQNKYIEKLENRINKAIEFLKENACYEEDTKYFHRDLELDNCEELLNILRGDNK